MSAPVHIHRERPILFSAQMVRALLDGSKTQTRRVVKGSPVFVTPFVGRDDKPTGEFGIHRTHDRVIDERTRCPYGEPGDWLWVREPWRTLKAYNGLSGKGIEDDAAEQFLSTAGTTPIRYEAGGERVIGDGSLPDRYGWGRYRHARFMPRWASRITLEITDVRVQRLHDITEDDARAEGVSPVTWGADAAAGLGHVLAFARLWEEINGTPSDDLSAPLGPAWTANPWVWALTFKRAQ